LQVRHINPKSDPQFFSYLHFLAACWGSRSPSEYIGEKELIDSPYLLIPPINFIYMPASENGSSGPGYQLLMDFFNNDWVIPTPDDLDQQLSVPKTGGRAEEAKWTSTTDS
jgi:hypothetical protein